MDKYHHVIKIVEGEEIQVLGINVRPRIKENLLKLKEKFNLIVFTAGVKNYAEPIINFLDPENELFVARFYRDTCTEVEVYGTRLYTKDLRVFSGLDMDETLLIDNSIISLAYQLENGVPIMPYYNDSTDIEFDLLSDYLLSLDKKIVKRNSERINLKALFKLVNETDYEVEEEIFNSDSSFNSELDLDSLDDS